MPSSPSETAGSRPGAPAAPVTTPAPAASPTSIPVTAAASSGSAASPAVTPTSTPAPASRTASDVNARPGAASERLPETGPPAGTAVEGGIPRESATAWLDADTQPIGFAVSEDVARDEWEAIADGCPHATFFHTPDWVSIFARSDPAARVRTRIFRFEDGARAVFPLLENRRLGGLFTCCESTAASCYGGWVSADALTARHAAAIVRSMRSCSPNLVWRVNPIDPFSPFLEAFATMPDTTEVLDLQSFADEDALRAHFRHSARKQIAKGCRAGLSAWISDRWEEWEEYYRIYQTRIQQWGKNAGTRRSIAFFRAAYEARGPKIKLWVVARDGHLVGGNLNFYQGRHCVEWHAAYDCALFSCGVRDFLVDSIIRDAWGNGYAWYDFNPSAGYEGTRRFKQTFGTTSLPSNLILWRRGIYRMEPARRMVRAVRRLRHHASEAEPAAAGASS